jgi:hypothetical protein
MSETIIEKTVCAHAEKRGWLVRKTVYQNRKGSPDRWFFRNSKLLLVEFKRPGQLPDPIQRREHVRLRAAGFPVHVIDDIDDGVRLIDAHTHS